MIEQLFDQIIIYENDFLDLSIGIGDYKKKSDYRYKLKIEPTGSFDGEVMGCVRIRGINDDCKGFDLSNLKDKVVIVI